jgi:triphosphoribosyl-dephospho-CoA synthase
MTMTPDLSLSPGTLAQIACVLEVTARKPGNVHRLRDFSDSTYLDFLLSAQAIGPALDRSIPAGVGAAVLDVVRSTRGLVASNTNLGMALLLAPLAAVPRSQDLWSGVVEVIRGTTVDDARLVYEAIRLASPGGLGTSAEQDVAREPTVTLLEAMRLASGRDAVARQYAEGFDDVFRVALPALARQLAEGLPIETAIIAAHLRLMADVPDTLIARKRGQAEAAEAARRAAGVLSAGWPETDDGRRRLEDLDAWLRADGHARNPGTTADLVAAGLFAALRDGTIRLPISPGGPGWSAPIGERG